MVPVGDQVGSILSWIRHGGRAGALRGPLAAKTAASTAPRSRRGSRQRRASGPTRRSHGAAVRSRETRLCHVFEATEGQGPAEAEQRLPGTKIDRCFVFGRSWLRVPVTVAQPVQWRSLARAGEGVARLRRSAPRVASTSPARALNRLLRTEFGDSDPSRVRRDRPPRPWPVTEPGQLLLADLVGLVLAHVVDPDVVDHQAPSASAAATARRRAVRAMIALVPGSVGCPRGSATRPARCRSRRCRPLRRPSGQICSATGGPMAVVVAPVVEVVLLDDGVAGSIRVGPGQPGSDTAGRSSSGSIPTLRTKSVNCGSPKPPHTA